MQLSPYTTPGQTAEALEGIAIGTLITATVAGIKRNGAFMGFATQDGYRYAKFAFVYRGVTATELVFLADVNAIVA